MRFTKAHISKFSALVIALLALTVFVARPSSTASAAGGPVAFVPCPNPPCACFPSCDETDGRMLSLSGGGLATFVGGTIEIGFTKPSGLVPNTTSIGVFDPDSKGPESPLGLWDDPTMELKFEIFSDPNNDGTGATLAFGPFLSTNPLAIAANNNWWEQTFPNVPAALSGDGLRYSYFLRITPTTLNPDDGALNGLKVRTDGTISLTGQTIQFIAKANSGPEFAIVGGVDLNTGNCPGPFATTYNGTWDFEFEVKQNTESLELWDGDFDFGNTQAPISLDTDDPNTPPIVPPFGGASAHPEGVANDGNGAGVGSPPDDNDDPANSCASKRSPNVTYTLTAPGGATYTNNNPSGTSEWERFLISTKATDNPDFNPATIPAGKWTLHIQGMDVYNQFALHFNKNLEPTILDGRGCSPGYWKQSQHFGSYPAGITPNTLFNAAAVGFENAFPGKTLVQVLSTGGGGLTALGRIITGAYLNAATISNFPYTAAQVVKDFNDVFPNGNYDMLKSKYEALQDPCPFDRNPGTQDPKKDKDK